MKKTFFACFYTMLFLLTVLATFVSASDKSEKNYLFCEAENADYEKGSIQEMVLDGAYGPEQKTLFFAYPEDAKWHDLGTGEDNPVVKMTFSVPEDGVYYLWFRVLHMSGNDDSIYYSIDGGNQWERQSFYNLDYPVTWDDECGFMKLYWARNVRLQGSNPFENNPLSLKKGTVELQIKFREVFAGTSLYLDKVMLTNDADYNPNKISIDPEADVYPETETDSSKPITTESSEVEDATSESDEVDLITTEALITDPMSTEAGLTESAGSESNQTMSAEKNDSAIRYLLTAFIGMVVGFVVGFLTRKSKSTH